MKRLLVIGAALICVIAVTLTILPWLVPASTVRSMAVNRIETITGLQVTAANDARISFLPRPEISIDDVRLSIPGRTETVAAIDRLLGRFSLLGFFSRDTPVTGLTVVRPRVMIPGGPEATDQWVPGSGGLIRTLVDAVTQERASRQLLSLDSSMAATGPVRILDGSLTIFGPDGETSDAYTQIEIAANWAQLGSPLVGNASFVWNGKVVELDASVDNPRDMLIGVMTPIKVDVVTAQGSMSIRGKSSLAENLLIEGSLGIESAAFDQALGWLGFGDGEAPGLDRLSLSSTMQLTGKLAKLNDVEITLDGNSGTGSLAVGANEQQIMVNGTLAMDALVLDRYLGNRPLVSPDTEEIGDALVASTELPRFGDLSNLDVDLRFSAAEMSGAGLTFGQTAASLVIREGKINVGIGEAAYKDGTLSGAVEIRPVQDWLIVHTKLNLRDVAIDQIVDTGPTFGVEGAVNGGLELRGRGRTLEELTLSLSGDGQIAVRDGAIRGVDADELAEAMTSRDTSNIGIRAGARSPFETLNIVLETSRGVTQAKELRLIAERFEISATGEVDLLKQYVSGLGQMAFYPDGRPEPREDGTLPEGTQRYEMGFRIDGPLDAPAVLPLVPLLKQGQFDIPDFSAGNIAQSPG